MPTCYDCKTTIDGGSCAFANHTRRCKASRKTWDEVEGGSGRKRKGDGSGREEPARETRRCVDEAEEQPPSRVPSPEVRCLPLFVADEISHGLQLLFQEVPMEEVRGPSPIVPDEPPVTTTRTRRAVKLPARFNDYLPTSSRANLESSMPHMASTASSRALAREAARPPSPEAPPPRVITTPSF